MTDIEIHIGDVFEDTDPRELSRRLTVVGFETTSDYKGRLMGFVIVRSEKGRHSRINTKRLCPTRGKRGYRRVATKEMPR